MMAVQTLKDQRKTIVDSPQHCYLHETSCRVALAALVIALSAELSADVGEVFVSQAAFLRSIVNCASLLLPTLLRECI
jgi:hypothetical protein